MTNSHPSLRHLTALLFALIISGCSRGHPSMTAFEDRSDKMWDRVGAELAKAAASQDASRILLVRQGNRDDFNLGPGLDRMENSFRKGISKLARSEPEIVAVPLAAPPPPPANLISGTYEAFRKLDPDLLAGALRERGPATLVVSLLGEPTGLPKAGTTWPPIICFSRDGSTNLADLIRSGVVVAAVAPRHTAPGKNEKDWFELRYTVVTKDNVASW